MRATLRRLILLLLMVVGLLLVCLIAGSCRDDGLRTHPPVDHRIERLQRELDAMDAEPVRTTAGDPQE